MICHTKLTLFSLLLPIAHCLIPLLHIKHILYRLSDKHIYTLASLNKSSYKTCLCIVQYIYIYNLKSDILPTTSTGDQVMIAGVKAANC